MMKMMNRIKRMNRLRGIKWTKRMKWMEAHPDGGVEEEALSIFITDGQEDKLASSSVSTRQRYSPQVIHLHLVQMLSWDRTWLGRGIGLVSICNNSLLFGITFSFGPVNMNSK